jgi:predicted nucleic acid-binding protein
MNPLALYVDSSVIGGYYDDEFQEATRTLWKQMEQGRFRFIASVLLQQEIEGAPVRVRRLMEQTFSQSESILPITSEAVSLAWAYLEHKVVPATYADDARHVAIAVVHRVTVIVSWNFKHLVNLRREAGFNSINILLGYPSVRIVSPLELIYGSEEEI